MKEKEYYDFIIEQMCENAEFRESFEKMKKQMPVSAMPWSKNYYDCKVEDCLTGASFSVCSEYEPEVKIVSLEKDEYVYYMHLYRCTSERIEEKQILDARGSGHLCARYEFKKEGEAWPRLLILFDLIKYKNDIYLMSTMHKKEFEDDLEDKTYISMVNYYKVSKYDVEKYFTSEDLHI